MNSHGFEGGRKIAYPERNQIGNGSRGRTDFPEDMNTATDHTRINEESAVRTSLRERVRQAAMRTESEIIKEALERHRWNRRKTAEALRISYRSLMYKMKHCNLRDDEQVAPPLES